MSDSPSNSDFIMGGTGLDALRGLTSQDIQDLVKLLAEKRSMGQQEPQFISPLSNPSHAVTLPKWSGKHEDFIFYIDRLRIRVEKEMAPFKEPNSICIDIIDTLPEDKKSRLASWLSRSKKQKVLIGEIC